MDKQIKEFINHLYNIGVVNQNNVNEILQIYSKHKIMNQEKNENKTLHSQGNSQTSSVHTHHSNKSFDGINHSVKDIMQNVLNEFLNKQDAVSIQNISYEIVGKYTEGDFLNKTKQAKKHFMYYLRFQTQSIKYYFDKWRVNRNKKWKVETKHCHRMPTEMRKEQDSLMSCTFTPKINKCSKSLSKLRTQRGSFNSIDTFSRLYGEYAKIKTKRAIKKEQIDKNESQLLRQRPQISNPNHSIYTNNEFCGKSFFDRQEEYEQMKLKNKEKILKSTEECDNDMFTFTPTINNSFKIDLPAHVRLYR